MEVIAEAIGGDNEKHLQFLSVSFVNPPVSSLNAIAFDFLSHAEDVRHFDGRTVLGCVAAVYGETDLNAVALHNYPGYRLVCALYFGEAETVLIPGYCLIQISYG